MEYKRTTRILLVALCSITVLSVVSTNEDIPCKYDEFVVQDVLGNLSCVSCPSCMVGQGLLPQCGSYIAYGTNICCKPCIEGVTYSSTNSIESCQPCGICADHQNVLEKCNRTHNSKCANSCDTGFYLSSVVGDCQECSWCCSDSGPSEHEDQCKKSGVPFYKQCTVDESIRCQPRCTDQQYVVVSETLNKTCLDCKHCRVGQGLRPKCQSVLTSSKQSKCEDCIPGKTFSDISDSSSCKACTVCEVGKKTERTCNKTHDTLCGDCNPGFYKKETACKQCSFCCGDKLDYIVPECKQQGMPKERQCNYTTRAITKCAPKKYDNNNLKKLLINIGISVAVVVLAVITVAIIVWRYRNCRGKYVRLDTNSSERAMGEPSGFSFPQKDSPSSVSTPTNIEFKEAGIIVQCQDARVGEHLLQDMYVEICWEEHQYLPADKIYLSPLIKFHSDRFKSETQIKLDIPHSAYKQEVNNTWQIKVFKQASPGKPGCPMKLKELEDPGMKVNACSVKFMVTELAAYIIVGVPGDPELAKKRMQCAVFGAKPKIGQLYSLNIYLFDDGESSYQKLKLQEKMEGRDLLQKLFRTIYPDVDDKSVIDVAIENVNKGWNGELSKESIESVEWRNSYRKFPMIEATFKHTDPQVRDFQASFRFTFHDLTVVIPVFHFSEHEVQDIPMGIPSSDQSPPADDIQVSIIEQGQPSLSSYIYISTLPMEALEKICHSIDQTLDKQCVATVAAKIIPSLTSDEVSYIRSSNEPFTSLINMVKSKDIPLTTDNLHSILQNEGLDSDVLMTLCEDSHLV